MFTGFIKCDCNGVCIEVDPFICPTTTSTTSSTTTTTTTVCNRWGYYYASYTCNLCEFIDYGFLYNSNSLTLDNFYQYGDLVISPYQFTGCDTGVSNASIPNTGVVTCEEIVCTTTTTTTLKPIVCVNHGLNASLPEITGSWVALDCFGVSVGGDVPSDGGTYYTGCIDSDTFEPTDCTIKETLIC